MQTNVLRDQRKPMRDQDQIRQLTALKLDREILGYGEASSEALDFELAASLSLGKELWIRSAQP